MPEYQIVEVSGLAVSCLTVSLGSLLSTGSCSLAQVVRVVGPDEGADRIQGLSQPETGPTNIRRGQMHNEGVAWRAAYALHEILS